MANLIDSDTGTWHAMYLGAFLALGVSNLDVANEMAELTHSNDQAVRAILTMRLAQEGDRVWPALEWLRAQGGVKPAAPSSGLGAYFPPIRHVGRVSAANLEGLEIDGVQCAVGDEIDIETTIGPSGATTRVVGLHKRGGT